MPQSSIRPRVMEKLEKDNIKTWRFDKYKVCSKNWKK